MTDFSEEIENEFKEMAFALEYAERGCWLFAVYNQASARAQIIKRLQTEINLPVFTWQYSEDKPYPIDYLSDLSDEQKQQRALVSFINTVDGGDQTIKSLDFNREKFAHYPHSLLFWVTENERGEIARKAGHFWAQRRGTFDFSKVTLAESTQNNSYGVGDWLNNLLNIDNYQEALRQLAFYQPLLTEYASVDQATTQRLMAETADKISYLLYYLGRYSEAVAFCQQALKLYRTLLGENDYSTIAAGNNLALLYLHSGRLTESETLLQKILIVLKQRFDHTPVMATVLNNLMELYYEQGKYAQAEPLHQQCLAIREAALGKNHPDVANSLNNLAGLYVSQGKYAAAEPLFQRSLAIWEAILGKNHPDVANSLNNLASLYEAQGKYAQAEPLYQRSLAIREKTLGQDHPDVANSLNNLAGLYYKLDKYAAAESLCQRSLAIREKTLGKDHPDVANSLNSLAMLYYEQGNYAAAEPLYQHSLGILEVTLGKDHPHTKRVKANYEQLLAEKSART